MGGRAGACDSLRCLSACLFLTVHLHRWVHFVHSVFVGRRVRHLCETSSTHPAANNTSTSRYLVLTCHRGISQVDKDDSVSLRYNGSYLDLACHLPRPPPSPCPRRPSTECNCTHEIKKQSVGFASSNNVTVSLTLLQRPPAADGRHGTSTGRDGPSG
ncbi:hypothetical protein IWX48DRAFT_416089 [Phyllosticta citricarpa]